MSQNFTFTVTLFTITSFVLGILKFGALLLTHSNEGVDESKISSDSGSCRLRGIIPGSLPDVRYKKVKSC